MPLPLNEQYDKIYRYCYFKVNNRELAEDLTQEAFLRFFSSNSYISRGKPLAYLYTIAKNLCIDAHRKPVHEPLPEDASADDTQLDSLETAIAVREAVAALPADIQEMLMLRFANGLTMKEICEITGISRFALRRKINGGLSTLRTMLKEEDFA